MKEFKFIHGLYTDDSILDEDDQNECLCAFYNNGEEFSLDSKNTKDIQNTIIKNSQVLYTVRPEQLVISGTVEADRNNLNISGLDNSIEFPKEVITATKKLTLSVEDFNYSSAIININDSDKETSPVTFKVNDKTFIRDMIFNLTGEVTEKSYSNANGFIKDSLYTVDDNYEFTSCKKSGIFYEGQLYNTDSVTEANEVLIDPTIYNSDSLTLGKKYKITNGYFIKDSTTFSKEISYNDITDYTIYKSITEAYVSSSKNEALIACTDTDKGYYTLSNNRLTIDESYPCYYTTNTFDKYGLYNESQFYNGDKTELYYTCDILSEGVTAYTGDGVELSLDKFSDSVDIIADGNIDSTSFKKYTYDNIDYYYQIKSTGNNITSIDGKLLSNSISNKQYQVLILTKDSNDSYTVTQLSLYIKNTSNNSYLYYKDNNNFYIVTPLEECSSYKLNDGYYYATKSSDFIDTNKYILNSDYSNAVSIAEDDEYEYNENQKDSDFYQKVSALGDSYIALEKVGEFPTYNYKYYDQTSSKLEPITESQINSNFSIYSPDKDDTSRYVVVNSDSSEVNISSSNAKLDENNKVVAISDVNYYRTIKTSKVTASTN